jgi:hypothetical protein
MTESEFQRDDRDYERSLDERDARERDDIMTMALDPSELRRTPQSARAQLEREFQELGIAIPAIYEGVA